MVKIQAKPRGNCPPARGKLEEATRYRVFIYAAGHAVGGAFKVQGLTAQEIADRFKGLRLSDPHPDILLAEATGEFDDEDGD